MTAGEIVGFVGGVIGAIAAIVGIAKYFNDRGKDRYKEGNDDGGIRGDIKYMRNNFDELRLDVKEIARNQVDQGERITRCEESVKSAHKRIDEIGDKVSRKEK